MSDKKKPIVSYSTPSDPAAGPFLWSGFRNTAESTLLAKLCPEDKDQLDRIEAMLTELTSLPHNKRPAQEESRLKTEAWLELDSKDD